jgi:hypothetical protein
MARQPRPHAAYTAPHSLAIRSRCRSQHHQCRSTANRDSLTRCFRRRHSVHEVCRRFCLFLELLVVCMASASDVVDSRRRIGDPDDCFENCKFVSINGIRATLVARHGNMHSPWIGKSCEVCKAANLLPDPEGIQIMLYLEYLT